MIDWELCNRLKLEYTTKVFVYKPDSFLENEKHNIQWDSEIETDLIILARRPQQKLIIKKKELAIKWIFLFRRTTKKNKRK